MMDYSHQFAVERMCRVFKVSKSGYYYWLNNRDRRRSKHKERETLIRYEYERSRCTYGSPRITDELNKQEYICSKSTVARYMKRLDIAARRKKRFKVTTNSNHDYKVFDNHLNREFEVEKPGKVWVSDITYIRVGNKWIYLTIIMDLADRMIVGWALSSDLAARNTVMKAFDHALLLRRPIKGFLFHSDRGVQYACEEFTKQIRLYDGIQSMSRKGNCWDNAVAESFFKTLKVECVYNYKLTSKAQAYSVIFDYIDGWYNTQRRHSALNGLSPLKAFEKYFKKHKLAA